MGKSKELFMYYWEQEETPDSYFLQNFNLIKPTDMKEDVFNAYVEKVLDLFKITKEELFRKDKRRDLVDARQLLYFLCSNRPMRTRYIQEYMGKNGYGISHSSIINGTEQIRKRLEEDKDYVHIVKEIERCIIL